MNGIKYFFSQRALLTEEARKRSWISNTSKDREERNRMKNDGGEVRRAHYGREMKASKISFGSQPDLICQL